MSIRTSCCASMIVACCVLTGPVVASDTWLLTECFPAIPGVYTGIAGSPYVPVTRVSKPNGPVHRSVVVLGFQGRIKDETTPFADLLRAELSKPISSEHWPWLKQESVVLVNREQMHLALSELRLVEAGLVSDTTGMRRLGNFLGAEAIVWGAVRIVRSVSREGDVPDADILRTGKGSIMRTYHKIGQYSGYLDYQIAEATVHVYDVLKSTQRTFQVESGSYRMLAWRVASGLSPAVWLEAVCVEGGIRTKDKDLKRLSQDARGLIEGGHFVEAGNVYRRMLEVDPYNHGALQNMAVVAEAVGNLNEADSLYKRALRLVSDSAGDTRDSQNRLRAAIAKLERTSAIVKSWGNTPIPVLWASDEDNVGAKEMATVRGGGSDRIVVYANGSASSQAIAKVPGGMRVTILSRSGSLAEVMLPDGKIGWVEADQLK